MCLLAVHQGLWECLTPLCFFDVPPYRATMPNDEKKNNKKNLKETNQNVNDRRIVFSEVSWWADDVAQSRSCWGSRDCHSSIIEIYWRAQFDIVNYTIIMEFCFDHSLSIGGLAKLSQFGFHLFEKKKKTKNHWNKEKRECRYKKKVQ